MASQGEGSSRKDVDTEQATTSVDAPYSIFTSGQRILIVVLASVASIFSPMSTGIYFPALNVLAKDYHKSDTLINLTVTTYMILQGLAPTFVASISDYHGRRIAYLFCFVIYIAANIGLALQKSYAALLVLRCIQSAGSSGTIALSNAVIADLVTSAERGSYTGYASMGTLLGPAIGPVIGGLLAAYEGWRSIFWFLAIFGGFMLLALAVLLPETCRRVVGNGSIPTHHLWNTSLLSHIQHERLQRSSTHLPTAVPLSPARHTKLSTILLGSLKILFSLPTGPILLIAGIFFAGFYMILTVLPSQLTTHYNLTTLQIGLCYLPMGVGCLASTIICGPFLLDPNFRRHARKLGMEISTTRQQDLSDFPIEAARLEVVLPLLIMCAASLIAFGWTMQSQISLAAPMILLFVNFFFMTGISQGVSTLVVDINRDNAGTASASMNLSRCWLGAAAVAGVNPLVDAIGVGWMSVIISGAFLFLCPGIVYIMGAGPRWRKTGEERRKRREDNGREEVREMMKMMPVGRTAGEGEGDGGVGSKNTEVVPGEEGMGQKEILGGNG